MKITRPQLTRLQTVYAQVCAHSIGFTNTREDRLRWASQILGRQISSFSALTLDQARTLIDAAQGALGHRAPLKAGSTATRRPARTAEGARRAGLDGRHDGQEFADTPELVSAEALETIASYRQRLNMDEAQFQAWLKSGSSPLKRRTTIRTTAEANKVIWALKNMLKAAGLWVDWNAA